MLRGRRNGLKRKRRGGEGEREIPGERKRRVRGGSMKERRTMGMGTFLVYVEVWRSKDERGGMMGGLQEVECWWEVRVSQGGDVSQI